MPHPPSTPARPRARITLSGVGVTFGSVPVLHGVDLTVSGGSRWAVVGENGRGKSTLLRVLAGTLEPDEGTVHREGTIAVAEQELAADDRTVGELLGEALAEPLAALAELDAAALDLARREPGGEPSAGERYATALDRAERLDAWSAERRVDVSLEALGAETDRSRRLDTLSVGVRHRVRLACLLGAPHDVLLLDEPTNHLDRAGLEHLTERLTQRPGAVVLVSHDRALISDAADRILSLDSTADGRPRVHGGGYEGYRADRTAEHARWQQEHERQTIETARLEGELAGAQGRLVSGWRPPKGTGKHQRSTRAAGLVQSVHRRQDALAAQSLPVPPPPLRLAIPPLPVRPGVLLAAEGVTVAGRLEHPVSLAVSSGSRLVVTGPNGAGKSTLLAVLAGVQIPDGGLVRRAAPAGLLRQESALPPDRRAADLFAEHVTRLVSRGLLPESEAIPLLALGLLRPEEGEQRIGELSVGQQRRLDLALVLAARPPVLLLDEPTNHLSIALVDDLTEALGATPAAVVLSTHDRRLLRDTASWPRLALGEGG
jgi:macrolide transport system ATP-binding/permease protein